MADPVIRKFGVLSALWVIWLGSYPCGYEGYPVRQAKIIRLQRRTFDTKKKNTRHPSSCKCINNGGRTEGSAVLVGDNVLHFSSEWKMTSVWKRLQRVGKKASKFQFTASYQSLTVECDRGGKWWVYLLSGLNLLRPWVLFHTLVVNNKAKMLLWSKTREGSMV